MFYDKLSIGCYDNGNSSTAITLDMGQSLQKVTLTGACTFTFTAPIGPSAGALLLIQDGTGSRVVTWPAAAIGSKYVNLTALGITVLNWVYDGTSYHFRNASTPQAVNNVHNTTPTAAELTTSFGAPSTLGRGFIGTVDDADGDAINYIVWTSDASFYWAIGTKAA